jgi:hypothetical protein
MEQLTSKPFVLIEKKEQDNGDIQLRYGESRTILYRLLLLLP